MQNLNRVVTNTTLVIIAMNNSPLVWIIIGVSGSGKTTVGRLLAEKLECDFLEGDRRHSVANIKKMILKQPLEDKDRRPWFSEIKDDIRRAIIRNREIVISCSALKTTYRKKLTSCGRVQLVWLNVETSILKKRLAERPEHYMKPEMLDSQLATFETPTPEESVITLDGSQLIDIVVSELIKKIIQKYPSLEKYWWDRYIE
jgi:gluconokinase